MASITITIPDNQVNRVIIAFGYQDFINGIPNPETKGAFIKRKTIEFYKNKIIYYESSIVAQTAISINNTDITNNITIT